MEIMGSTAVAEIANCLWTPLKKHVGYLIHFSNTVKHLKYRMEDLVARRNDIERRVSTGCFMGEEENDEAVLWLTRATCLEGEAERISQAAGDNKRCLCLPSLRWHYCTTKRARKLVSSISKHLDEGKFNRVTTAPLPPDVVYQDVPSIKDLSSVKTALGRVMDALHDGKITRIGVWGMGGVGKTTLVKNVNNLIRETNQFSRVIMVLVSKDVDIKRVQDDVAERLGFSLKDRAGHSRTEALRNRLMQEKKLLIILDDLWEQIELADLGIPFNNEDCKIIFTTRREAVCRQMETQINIKVDVLSKDESWKLFKEKVGHIVDDPTLHTVTERAIEECGGLPLAIVTLGRALRGVKSIRVWNNALAQMKISAPDDIEGMEDKVYQSIKISYERLRSALKPGFLFCSLFPEDYDIDVDMMIRCWIAEGFLDDRGSLEEIMDRGHTWVEDLKSSCLLLDGGKKGHVKMHDIVRDVAISIASKENDECCKSLVRAGVGLKGLPLSPEWDDYRRISFIRSGINQFPEGMHCSNLLTLLMQENKVLSKIPGQLFEGTRAIRVLDLSFTAITSLPPSLSNLVNLRSLCLRGCKLRTRDSLSPVGGLKQLEFIDISYNVCLCELPIEIGELANLRMLDLTRTRSLEFIPYGIISRLTRLEVLRMFKSFWKWDTERETKGRDDGTGSNANLAEVASLKELSCLEIQIANVERFPDKHASQLKNWVNLRSFYFDLRSLSTYQVDPEITLQLHGINLAAYDRSMILFGSNHIPEWVRMLLPVTAALFLSQHNRLSRLDDIGAFPNLEFLMIMACEDFECVFRETVASPNLHHLELYDLPNLQELLVSDSKEENEGKPTSDTCLLHNLRQLRVHKCPRLTHELLPYSLLRNMEKLTSLKISECEEIEHVFGGASPNAAAMLQESDYDVLSKLETLELRCLANMKRIWSVRLVVTLQNLTSLWIQECNGLRKSVLSFAEIKSGLPNLVELIVRECRGVEEIISVETVGDNNSDASILPKLRYIQLRKLPALVCICGRRREGEEGDAVAAPRLKLGWHSLEEIHVNRCPKLKKLQPLEGGPHNVPSLKWILGERKWWEGLDWGGDETTRAHFQSMFMTN
ncbi:hypothetical protein ACLOJK_031774 [Asimina triloba]